MKFHDALKVAYQTPWSYNSTFEIYIAWNQKMLTNSNVPVTADYDARSKASGGVLPWSPRDNERLSLHLKTIELPNITANELKSWTGNRWARANGATQQYTFSMTFRDSNQLEFYRLFATQFREQHYRYFDDYTFNVFVSKDSDYGDGYHNDDTGFADRSWRAQPLMSLKRCAIQAVSAITFSNDAENQHLEFSVTCVANDIELYDTGARQFIGGNGALDVTMNTVPY